MGAGDGHAPGVPRRVHAAHDLRVRGIRDVDHLETGTPVRDVGVGAGDGHAIGKVRRVHAARPMEVVPVVNAVRGRDVEVRPDRKCHEATENQNCVEPAIKPRDQT